MRAAKPPPHWAILTDVTKCIGCEKCVQACKDKNKTGEDQPWSWQNGIADLSATRWTTIDRAGDHHYVRRQCRHCLDPACASACPVGALRKTPEGPVVYDSTLCMGCRYCMMACPFKIPRYEWGSPIPRVRKCVLCLERIKSGEAQEPACTEACPTKATIFGEREELLAEAHRRLAATPDLYVPHVWGETEAGGTSVLTISNIDIELPATVSNDPLPGTTKISMGAVPFVFVGVGVTMGGLRWIIDRRNRLRQERAAVLAAAASDAKEIKE
ncbi:MAG: 4Fe-4S dicluster domain-containing protein [Planctomycetota bacterium]